MDIAKQKKPRLIVISGAPGSGKTTLAKKLSEIIQYTYVNTDTVLQNIWMNNIENSEYDRETTGMSLLYKFVEDLSVEHRLSVIIDAAPGDPGITSRLSKAFDISHVHCSASNVNERFYTREIMPNGKEPDWLGPLIKELEEKLPESSKPPDLGCEIIEVNTDNGYLPTIREIIKRLEIPDGYILLNLLASLN